ncbi:MAG: thioredoxin family protein [Aigarchaeota archaeon]|nr:thioredoxin family protein [Candidatus Pelearchaeum maunauluense]
MVVLREKEKNIVRSKFEKELVDNVRLVVFTQEFECEYCNMTRELVEELAALTDKIKVEIYDFEKDSEKARRWGVDKVPALLIFGKRENGIRYFGIPSGYEFASLLEDIVDVSRGGSRLSQATKEKLKSVTKPVHIQVFVTPTCPYCPGAVRIAHQMALENENIVADMIESLEFPYLANRYQVMAVPKVVINDVISFEGALPEAHFLEHVMLAVDSEGLVSRR